jgi:hypothetical protein
MPRILTKLKIHEISSVDRGAGEGVKVVLMKRDAPPQGSVREKLQFLIEQLRRGYPDMPVRQARAEAWNALSDDEQIELLREERQNMNKLNNSEVFADWWRQLDATERARYRRQQALIDAEMDAEGTSSRDSEGHGGGRYNGKPTSPNIAPGAPKAPVFEKGNTLTSVIKQHEFMPLCMMIAKSGDGRRIEEDEIMSLASHYAAERNMSLGKFLNSDSAEARYVCKAASVCREGVRARQAERNLANARERGQQAQRAYLARE